MPPSRKQIRRSPNGVEHHLVETLDERSKALEFYRDIWPDIVQAAHGGDVETMFRRYSPVAVLEVAKQMRHGKTDKIRLEAAKTLMHMYTGTPVARNISITKNLEGMSDKEIDALLASKLKRTGLLPPAGDEGGHGSQQAL